MTSLAGVWSEIYGTALRRPDDSSTVCDVTPRVRHVGALLAVGVATFACAGAAVAVAALTGADHLMGFKRLLDLNGERNLPTWFSSGILLSAAAVLAAVATSDRRRCPSVHSPWSLLALVFLGLSLDEMASLHEMTNEVLRTALHTGPLLYFPWIFVGVGLASGVFAVQRPLLRALPRGVAVSFIVAGAVYMTGAVALEAAAAPFYARQTHPLLHAALITLEESLEMIGIALFIVALVRFWRDEALVLTVSFDDRSAAAPGGTLRLAPRRTCDTMLLIVAVLAAANVMLQSIHFLTPLKMPQVVRLFDLAREGNIPTWYQSFALLACGALAFVIAAAEWRRPSAFRWSWLLTGLLCVGLSADEAGSLHEMMVTPLRNTFDATGLLYYPWIAVGAAGVVVLAIVSRRFVQSLPARTRRSIFIAVAVYLTGALGVEALGGMYAESHDRRTFTYGLITTVEETLEGIGIVLAARALLEYGRDWIGTLRLSIRD